MPCSRSATTHKPLGTSTGDWPDERCRLPGLGFRGLGAPASRFQGLGRWSLRFSRQCSRRIRRSWMKEAYIYDHICFMNDLSGHQGLSFGCPCDKLRVPCGICWRIFMFGNCRGSNCDLASGEMLSAGIRHLGECMEGSSSFTAFHDSGHIGT